MDLGLNGAVSLITGASRGIGLAAARSLAAEGCHIILSSRTGSDLAEAAQQLATAASVTTIVADVTVPEQAEALITQAAARHGGLDILVNNVGGSQGGRTLADSTDADWMRTLELNLLQTVRMMRLAIPHMAGRPHPAIVNISSISGWSPQLAGSGQYGAAKAALIFDADLWARELWAHGIRLNTVSPRLDPGAGQWLGPIPRGQPGGLRRLCHAWLSDGAARPCRGSGRCRDLHGLPARPLDQRAQHSGRWPGAALRGATAVARASNPGLIHCAGMLRQGRSRA